VIGQFLTDLQSSEESVVTIAASDWLLCQPSCCVLCKWALMSTSVYSYVNGSYFDGQRFEQILLLFICTYIPNYL